MLTLTRKIGEKVILTTYQGDQIIVEVAKVKGERIVLSFDAPEEVRIDREEVHRRKVLESNQTRFSDGRDSET